MEGSLVEVGFLEELFGFGMQLTWHSGGMLASTPAQAGSQIHGQRVEHWWSRRRRWRLPGQHCQVSYRAPAPAAVQQQQQQVVGAPVLGSGGWPMLLSSLVTARRPEEWGRQGRGDLLADWVAALPQTSDCTNEEVRAVQALPDGRLASASQDHTARLWTPEDEKSEGAGGVYYDIGDTFADDNHWVVSLAALLPGIVPECPQGGLVTGCLDKLIRVYDHQGKQQRMLQGHDGGVIYFSWTAADQAAH
ncbi:conserved unknown protein [Ectocarpus siliculosus]|uniref:Uncharacterized protein n=1 Tax=Ectocarpus siliculosus TaxID=2880 RepID=D8LHS1_ECTSI|nr:conserved unknown protein [Ectocarpus siliculosus]|eukprot:CBN74352.1 conserved unknown protein [Ectocarpus siliculosus]